MDMATCNKAISGFRFRLAGILVLRRTLVWLSCWAFAWGLGVLILRGIVGVSTPWLVWPVLGAVPIAAAAAAILTRRDVPPPQIIRALFDAHGNCGGLLMASSEVPLGAWADTVGEPAVPSLHWRAGRTVGLLAVAVAFLLVSFLVPRRAFETPVPRPLNVGREIDMLAEQVKVLQDEKVIDERKAEQLSEKLNQIAGEATGQDPVKTWEAMDHLSKTVSAAADKAAEAALRDTESLAKAESLAAGLAEDADKLSREGLTAAMEKLAELAEKAERAAEDVGHDVSKEIQDALDGEAGEADAEDLKRLAEALGEAKEALAGRLGRLIDARLIDAELAELNERLGECNTDGLAELLGGGEPGQGDLSAAELIELWCGSRPGRGGVNRGRADAPMTWTDPSNTEGVDFTEQVLPPATLAALKKSRLVGVGVGAPTVAKPTGPVGGGALGAAGAGGGSAHTHTILPRHRGAVGRYFERKPR